MNIWMNLKLENNSFGYWSGFGWEKRKKFNSAHEWESYLKKGIDEKAVLLLK